MISRPFVVFAIAGAFLLTSAIPSDARPRRIAQNCSTAARNCKLPVRRLVPCLNDPSRLCAVMRGEEVALGNTPAGSSIAWQAVAGASHYQLTILGYNSEWQSQALSANKFDYSALQLKDGSAYLVTINAYGPQGLIQSTEQALNIPAQIKANSQ